MKESNVIRLALDVEASNALQCVLEKVKSQSHYLLINNTSAVSWIVKRFCMHYFESDKTQFINDHFDQKTYLNDFMKANSQSENLLELFQNELKRINLDKSLQISSKIECNTIKNKVKLSDEKPQ